MVKLCKVAGSSNTLPKVPEDGRWAAFLLPRSVSYACDSYVFQAQLLHFFISTPKKLETGFRHMGLS